MKSNWIYLACFGIYTDYLVVKSFLEACGIKVFVENENDYLMVTPGTHSNNWVKILVHQLQFEEAVQTLKEKGFEACLII